MSFPHYPAYKDSGVEWLGEVPEHWPVMRLGQIGRLSKGNGGTKQDESDSGVPCVRYGDLYTTHNHFIRETRSFVSEESAVRYTPIQYGDALLAASGETIEEIGKSAVNLMHPPACCGGDVIVFRPTLDVNPVFLAYALDCPEAQAQKAEMGRGFTVVHIYSAQLRNLSIGIPPRLEQVAIATFLDRETAKIDALVAEYRTLIELLKEKRQAVISHAVTKGLDPTVPMKYSGVEWLGEVPEDWMQTPIKHVLNEIIDTEHKTAPFFEDGEYLVVRTTNIKNGKLVLDGAKYTDFEGYAEWTKRGVPEPGDILFTREAPAGEACLIATRYEAVRWRKNGTTMRVKRAELDSRFGLWSLYGGVSAKFIFDLSQGSTVSHFNRRLAPFLS